MKSTGTSCQFVKDSPKGPFWLKQEQRRVPACDFSLSITLSCHYLWSPQESLEPSLQTTVLAQSEGDDSGAASGGLFWIRGPCLLEPSREMGMDGAGGGNHLKIRSQHNTDSGPYRPEFPPLLSPWVTRSRYHTSPGLSLSICHVGVTG